MIACIKPFPVFKDVTHFSFDSHSLLLNQQSKYRHAHFTNGETEAQRGLVNWQGWYYIQTADSKELISHLEIQ